MGDEDTDQHGTGQTASNGQYGASQHTSTGQYGTRQTYQHGTGHPSPGGVSVYEAAQVLGVTVDAIRKRVQRGTIPHKKDESGRVWVLLEAAKTMQEAPSGRVLDKSSNVLDDNQDRPNDALVEALHEQIEAYKDQVEYLRAELARRGETHLEESRRKDSIIAALTQRIPELPAPPQEEQNTTETVSEETPKGTVPPEPQKPSERRGWVSRFFFGP